MKQRASLKIINVAHRLGIEIRRYRPVQRRRAALIASYRIATVVDVGANEGQYAQELRGSGYIGRIESFEPNPEAFERLAVNAAQDPNWSCHRLALGDAAGEGRLNVTARSESSSLLGVIPDGHGDDSGLEVVGVTGVPIARFDDCDVDVKSGATLLKLDVQGYEDAVLRGAEQKLSDVTLIECELSVRALYEGQPLLSDLLDLLRDAGFSLRALNPGFYDPLTGEILQFDGIFCRSA